MRKPVENRSWSLRNARSRFSAVVEAAQRGAAQLVTKRGAPAVVVVAEDYARLKALEEQQAPSFVDRLLAMPQDDEAFDRGSPPRPGALMDRFERTGVPLVHPFRR
jgi:prevent-host-death family protein